MGFISAAEKQGDISPYVCVVASFGAYREYQEQAERKLERYHAGWRVYCTNDSGLNNCNYRGVAYINDALKKIVVAHRGTVPNSLHTWLRTNMPLIWSGKVPPSYWDARHFSQCVRNSIEDNSNYVFVETGHSLGGMYAALNSYAFNCRGIAFDSPSMGHILKDEKRREQVADHKLKEYLFTNFVTAPDLINVLGGCRYGEWIRLYVPFAAEETMGNKISDLFAVVLAISSVAMLGGPFGTLLALLGIGVSLTAYDLRCHDIQLMVDAFDPTLGVPYLQAEIFNWPNFSEYMRWRSSSSYSLKSAKDCVTEAAYNHVVERNQRYERFLSELRNLRLGSLMIPAFHQDNTNAENSSTNLSEYTRKSKIRYSLFYPDDQNYVKFLVELGSNGRNDLGELYRRVPLTQSQ